MKINFTKKQFRNLLDLIYAGNWLINANKDKDEDEEEYKDLIQYIYSFANKMDCEDLIEYDKEFKQYFETRELEDGPVREFIDEYDDDVFWLELSSRLAERDTRKNMSEDQAPSHGEFISRVWAREEEYNDEFMDNGLDNVRVGDL